MSMSPRKLRSSAKKDLKETEYLLKAARKHLLGKTELVAEIKQAAAAVRETLRKKDDQNLPDLVKKLEELVDVNLVPYRPNQVWETVKAMIIAVSIALFIRWLFIEPFRIPSGSMIPTLLIGDQLMVNKLVFGPNIPFTTKKLFMPRAPRRGEVVVFRYPKNPREDYIKRVVGLPGDKIEVRDRRLYINDKLIEEIFQAPYHGPTGESDPFDLYLEQLGDVNHEVIHLRGNSIFVSAAQNFGPITVPEDSAFGMGDNRDRSADSRSWGFIPYSHLKGKAMFIHLPLDPDRHYLPNWSRFFMWIN